MQSRLRLSVVTIVLTLLANPGPCARGILPVPPADHEEAARVQLVRGLLVKRAQLARAQNIKELQACDQEIKRHPAPADADASKRLVGKWRSPRHDYLYLPDGTWTMLPAKKGTAHGRWQISGNQIEVTSGYDHPESTTRYTLILLTDEDYVCTDGESVFCDTRLAR